MPWIQDKNENSSKDTELMGVSQGILMRVQPSDVTSTNKLQFPSNMEDQKAPRCFPGVGTKSPKLPKK